MTLLVSAGANAQSRPYSPGQIVVPPGSQTQMSGKKLIQNRPGKGNQKKAAAIENASISPDDPLLVQKKLRDLYQAQIEKNLRDNTDLQKQIDALDKIITSVESDAGKTEVAVAPAAQTEVVNKTSVAVNNDSIPGTIPAIRTENGNSTTLTCPDGYMSHTPGGTRGNTTVCVPRPSTASSRTNTPGNMPIPPAKSATGSLSCPAGYTLSSRMGAGYDNIICEPNITEIAPGKFSCLFVDQWPEADANGIMKCVSSISDDGSTRICGADAIANQGCVPGYFYNKKMRRYYPTREAGQAAADALTSGTTTPTTATTAKPADADIKKYIEAYGANVSSPENVARIKQDAATNGVSAAELDRIMGWAAGTAQGAFNQVP